MASNIYMKVAGVDGESQEANHKGWIECTRVDFNVHSPVSYNAGGGSSVGAAEPSPVSVYCKQGKHSPEFQKRQFEGKSFDTIDFEFLKQTGDDTGKKFYILKLKFAQVSNYAPDLSGQSELMENVTFTYEEIEVEYFGQNSNNQLSRVGGSKYNLKEKKAG